MCIAVYVMLARCKYDSVMVRHWEYKQWETRKVDNNNEG